MINKSKAASLLVALFAATALAACGGNGSSSAAASSSKAASSTATSSSTAKSSSAAASSSSAAASSSAASSSSAVVSSSSSNVPAVPVVEGKVTFYFHFKASEKVASLPEYVSPYMDGVINGWNQHPGDSTKADPVEFQLLTGTTDVYYGQIAVNWADISADAGYQLTLGYNAKAKVGNSMMGVDYTMKSDYCNTFSGLSHPVFAEPKDGIVDLMGDGVDYQTFSACPVAPVVLKNYTLTFDTSTLTDIPTHVTGFMIKGSFNNWTSVAMTQDATTKTLYSIVLGDLIASAQVQFCVAPVTLAIHDVQDAYLLTGTGTHLADEMDTTDTTKIKKPGNLTYTPLKIDGDNAKQSWGKLTTYTGYTWPTAPVAMTNDVTITLTNSGTGTVASDATLYIAGNFLAKTWGDAVGVATCAMTKSTDGKTYTFVIDKQYLYQGVDYAFDVITNSNWKGKLAMTKGDGLADFAFQAKKNYSACDITGDFAKIGVEDSGGTIDYHGNFVNGIVITLTNSGTGTLKEGAVLAVAGGWNGWSYVEANYMTKSTDGTKWTYTFADGVVNANETYEFGIITNSNWSGKLVMTDPTDATKLTNLAFTAVAGKTHVNVAGDFAKIGVTDSAATIEYVA
jgi:hypothetical protein